MRMSGGQYSSSIQQKWSGTFPELQVRDVRIWRDADGKNRDDSQW